jgi:hypothetical protein
MRLVLAATALTLAGGCVDPSTSIATELSRYGLDPTQARCVGERLETSLSIAQLQELARAASAANQGDTTPGRLTGGDLVRASSQVRDPKIPIEVLRAANGCGVSASQL